MESGTFGYGGTAVHTGYPSAVKDLIGGVGDIYIVEVCIVFVIFDDVLGTGS